MKQHLGSAVLVTLTLATSAIVGVVACTSESEPSGSSSSSGGPNSSGGPGTDSGSGSKDGGSSSGGPTPGRTTKYGSVGITSTQGGGWAATANIYKEYSGFGACEISSEGTCKMSLCKLRPEAGDPPIKLEYGSAGDIAISGATIPSGTVLKPTEDGNYSSGSGEETVWQGGEEIKFHAAGNAQDVGPFDLTLTAPPRLTMLTPPVEDNKVIISKKTDFEFTWSVDGASSGIVSAGIAIMQQEENKHYQIVCTFEPGDKKGKIPSSMLSKLPDLEPGFGGGFFLTTVDQKTIDVSGYEISASTSTFGASPAIGVE